jgi:hypothetical protein
MTERLICSNCNAKYPPGYKGILTCCSPQKQDDGFTPIDEIKVIKSTEHRYVRKPITPNNCNKYHYDRYEICKDCKHYKIEASREICQLQVNKGKAGLLWHPRGIPNMDTTCPEGLWTKVEQRPPVTECVAVTALSTKLHSFDRQRMCLQTWKLQGLKIYAINTKDEIDQIKNQYKDVDVWIEQNEVSTDYNYPTQLIRNMANVAIDLDTPILLINSDIEMYDVTPFLNISDDVQRIGIRWNYDTEYSQIIEFQYGLDLFSFTPGQARLLPTNFPYAIGQAMWDYAVPHILRLNGIKLDIVHQPVLFHKNHIQNWNDEGWKFGWKWLRKNYSGPLFTIARSDVFREAMEDNYRYDHRLGKYVKKKRNKV